MKKLIAFFLLLLSFTLIGCSGLFQDEEQDGSFSCLTITNNCAWDIHIGLVEVDEYGNDVPGVDYSLSNGITTYSCSNFIRKKESVVIEDKYEVGKTYRLILTSNLDLDMMDVRNTRKLTKNFKTTINWLSSGNFYY